MSATVTGRVAQKLGIVARAAEGVDMLALAQNVVHQVAGSGDGFLFGVTLFGVELVKELLIVALLGFEAVYQAGILRHSRRWRTCKS